MTPVAEPDKIPWHVWRIALVVVFGAFLSMLDASVVNVGLDTIRGDLEATLDQVQWVSSAYLIALAVSLPLCGWLGRRVGVGRLWLWALAVFTIASGLCAAASTVDQLIGLRLLQGIAAGLLVPAGQTILGQAAGPHRLGRVMGTLGIAVSSGPAIGPTAGGLLLHYLSWEWLFLINLPIGVAGLVLGLRIVPRGEPEAVHRLDWMGFALVGTALPLVVYAVTRWGEEGSLTTSVLVPLVLGVAGLLGYGLRAWWQENPLLDLRLFRNPVYATAAGSAAFTGAAVFGAMLVYPLYFQILRGQSVVATGLSLISLGLGTALALPLSGRLTDRYGGGIVSVWGNALTIVTTVPFAFTSADTSALWIQVLLLIRGIALALAMMPATTAAYATVGRNQLPDATTQVNILMRVGGAVGSAVLAVVLARQLAGGAVPAFHTVFWWLTGASVIALAWTAWLWLTLRNRSTVYTAPAESPVSNESGLHPSNAP